MTVKTEQLVASLTAKQITALNALSLTRFESARDLEISGSTLTSLVKAGLADVIWRDSSYREPKTGAYRIRGYGCLVRNRIAKEAKVA